MAGYPRDRPPRANQQLFDPTFYTTFIADRGLDEDTYRPAVSALTALMPQREIEREYDTLVEARAQPSLLHPASGHRLTHHPLRYLLGGPVYDANSLCELVRLGLDLVETDGIAGIQAVRRRLLVLEEYLGALFEIEVGAELVRAGLEPTRSDAPDWLIKVGGSTAGIECRYQGAPLPIAILPRLLVHLAFREFGTLRIAFKPGAGGADSIETVMTSLASGVDACLDGRAIDHDSSWYRIHYDDTGLRTLDISLSEGGHTYSTILARKARDWMRQKREQLTQPGRPRPPSLVALDFRSLIGGLPRPGGSASSDPYYTDVANRLGLGDQRSALLESVTEFLVSDATISGALTWWRRFEFENTNYQRLWRPWEVLLLTKDNIYPIENSEHLAEACRLALAK